MDPVVTRGDEEEFDGRPHAVDQLGVDPELVEDTDLHADEEHEGVEAEEGGGDEEDHLDVLGPGEAEGDREIVLFRAVVGDVGSPPETLFVGHAVGPVAAKVYHHEANNEAPPSDRDVEGRKIVEEEDDAEGEGFDQGGTDEVADPDPGGGQPVLDVVFILLGQALVAAPLGQFVLVLAAAQEPFQDRQRDHHGHGVDDDGREVKLQDVRVGVVWFHGGGLDHRKAKEAGRGWGWEMRRNYDVRPTLLRSMRQFVLTFITFKRRPAPGRPTTFTTLYPVIDEKCSPNHPT